MRTEDLLPGEHLVLVARQHWVVVFRPFVLTILGAVILVIVPCWYQPRPSCDSSCCWVS